jgi:hypothetical protein
MLNQKYEFSNSTHMNQESGVLRCWFVGDLAMGLDSLTPERKGKEGEVQNGWGESKQNKPKENINQQRNEASQKEISPSGHRCHTSQLASWCRSLQTGWVVAITDDDEGRSVNPGSTILEIPRQGPNTAEVGCMILRGQWKEA